MSIDHDAAADMVGLDGDEDLLRFEMEIWVVWEEEPVG